MKVTVSGISYDYNFNNQGAYRGIVLGAGISNVETKSTSTVNDISFSVGYAF